MNESTLLKVHTAGTSTTPAFPLIFSNFWHSFVGGKQGFLKAILKHIEGMDLIGIAFQPDPAASQHFLSGDVTQRKPNPPM